MSSNFGFLIPWEEEAAGHPDNDLCVRKVPFICPVPVHEYIVITNNKNFKFSNVLLSDSHEIYVLSHHLSTAVVRCFFLLNFYYFFFCEGK